MRTPKLAVVSAAVLMVLAGCGQSADSAGAGSPPAANSAPTDPAARIDAAGKKLEQSSFKFSIETGEMTAEGVRHQPSDSMSMTMSGAAGGSKLTIEIVQIATDMYMKMDLGAELDAGDDPDLKAFADGLGGWRHISKEEAASNVGSLAAAGAEAMGSNVTKDVADLKETAPNTFTGTVDLSKAGLSVADAETIAALGDKVKAVPVTITLDDQERLSSIVLELPATGKSKAQTTTVKYFDFDNVTQPKAPPADQVKEG